MKDKISIKGARVHNLKNLSLDIPKNQMVVITGLSGSGKSSLAFDTIYAEGQRRYVESLSAYARQFLGLMEKPDVDYIEGLSPAISIDQKSSSRNPRSTVGTVTEVYDYLRLLYARIGEPHCYNCGRSVKAQTVQDIVDSIFNFPDDKTPELKVILLAPVIKARKGTYEELFSSLLAKGFSKVRVNGEIVSLEDEIDLDRYKKHNIELVIDRLVLKVDSKDDPENIKRVTDSVERGLNIGEGEIIVSKLNDKEDEDILFSENFACAYCGISFSEIEPHTFSFNSPYGACPSCNGLGIVREIDPTLIYNPRLSITEGGIYPWSRNIDVNSWRLSVIQAVAEKYKFDIRKPIGDLEPEILQIILYGAGKEKFPVEYNNRHGNYVKYTTKFEGVIPNLTRRYKETDSEFMRSEIEKYMRDIPCSVCLGKKLKPEALAVTIADKNIDSIVNLSIKDAYDWLEEISSSKKILNAQQIEIARVLFKEILTRLNFLVSVGLDYLTLSRTARTLSGGEAQRIRLASQIGTGLTGVLYVLDEPSIGLHQRDNKRLLESLEELKELGNSVLIVEHDEDTIRNADWVIDLGPGAGEKGGELVAEGTPAEIIKDPKSVTGEYLSGKKVVGQDFVKGDGSRGNGKKLTIKKATEHNLKNIDVEIPLGRLVCITGVSGSGKSTLINDILYKSLSNYFYKSRKKPGAHEEILGLENIDKIINIDQSPIGRTPRSNPATYTGVFTHMRDIFSRTNEAKARGY
ncbi:excinuclease ABC subunit UvrA, partial [Candidatus Dojkabacteria bacterium]|nr:excinuclease ABC subunit UvrA [Candidatus Dojkabacteria bacterium]